MAESPCGLSSEIVLESTARPSVPPGVRYVVPRKPMMLSLMFARAPHSELTTQQTIPESTFTYAIPPPELDVQMPLRKYGFHGLSYASIVRSIARHKGKSEEDVSIVVAHLGSGASACCILKGKSIDTCESHSIISKRRGHHGATLNHKADLQPWASLPLKD